MRQNPKGRQTKARARLNRYEALLAEERNAKLEDVQIHIPAGQRLGSTVIEADGLRKGFGDRLLIEDLSFSLPPAGIVGVIGPNGAGKTTLFRMIVGDESADAGSIKHGETVDFAYVDQSRDALDPDKNVWEEISEGYEQIKVGDREINSRAYVAGFNFKGSDQQRKVGVLSGGERNRVHLAKLLRRGGNVLLLDEPTNDLDVDTLRALEEALLAFPGCAVIISHDRWFLDRVATHVLAFEGDSQVVWFEGNFEAYEEHRHAAPGRRGRPAAPDHLQEADESMSARTRPPFRADHVGSLLRPERLHKARADYKAGTIDLDELRGVEDECILEVIQLQRDAGLQSVTDGELRRTSWHMDFIYSLGGITQVAGESLHVHFRDESGEYDYAPPAMKVSDRVKLTEPIFADAFTYLRDNAQDGQTPEADDPVAQHGPLSRRQLRDRPRRLPGHGGVLGGPDRRLQPADARGLRPGRPLPAARRHEPGLRQRPRAARAHRRHRR